MNMMDYMDYLKHYKIVYDVEMDEYALFQDGVFICWFEYFSEAEEHAKYLYRYNRMYS